MCSKVLNGHIILTDTSITTILAPEMTYTPKLKTHKESFCIRIRDGTINTIVIEDYSRKKV